ncbi:hypothetical protein [Chryseobacterium sp. RLHN22]|uniref:hypothetical protein n=1 Tax=Chryseobacterium sp. RLHN22 TaxID=3437885 RepID=UPI003D9AF819
MEVVTDLNKINQKLKNFKGSKAQFWLFDISHKKIAIRISISNKEDEDVMYLVIASCQYIRGDFSWNNPNIYVDKYYDEKKMEHVYRLLDLNADFKLEGLSGIALAKGLESEFGDSFEDFLKKD